MFATPVAYLIDEAGVIIQDAAVGTDAILSVLARVETLVPRAGEVVGSA